MVQYVYDTESVNASRSGRAVVLDESGVEVATVDVERGGMRRGPVWSWQGCHGAWSLHARRHGRAYEVRREDGTTVGTVERTRRGGALRLKVGSHVRIETRRSFFTRDRAFELPDGRGRVSVSQHTPGGWRRGKDRWRLDLPESVHDDVETVLLALPLVLDHWERQQPQDGD